MYRVEIENNLTHQKYTYNDIEDKNKGKKLFYEFTLDTSNLENGEYSLTVFDNETIVVCDLLRIGDFNSKAIQYSKGNNTYIEVVLPQYIQGKKSVVVNEKKTTVYADEEYTAVVAVEINATPVYSNGYKEGETVGYENGYTTGYTNGTNDGYESGYTVGEKVGYQSGYDKGEEIGFNNGREKGYTSGYTVGESVGYSNGYDNGYTKGNDDGYSSGYTIGNENGYNSGYSIGSADGYESGYTIGNSDGYESGYTIGNSDGYNTGYDVGNTEGYQSGYTVGEEVGYDKGVLDGTANAGETIAETARVLEITENGIYASQYSEPTYPDVTGELPDGVVYDYLDLNNIVYDTGIVATPDSRIEFWWKPNEKIEQFNTVVGSQSTSSFIYKICGDVNNQYRLEYGQQTQKLQIFLFSLNSNIWNHIIVSPSDGLVVNGEKLTDLDGVFVSTIRPNFLINGSYQAEINKNANGKLGVVKIDDNIFIPTENGYKNYLTNELLTIKKDGEFVYYNPQPIIHTGNLIKTVNVNVPPRINRNNLGINFSYSTFSKIPDNLINWDGTTNINNMFRNCTKLLEIDIDVELIELVSAFENCSSLTKVKLNTANATNFSNTFAGCTKLTEDSIKDMDFSSATNMSGTFKGTAIVNFPTFNTSKVNNMYSLFEGTHKTLKTVEYLDTSQCNNISNLFYDFSSEHMLEKVCELDCTNVTNIGYMFSYYQDRMDYFTDCGGFKNLKIKWDDNYGLRACANLTYQSCINILNGLYDFVGNSETPTSSQGKLKVHQNFLNLVGDEISIGTNKGWTITA